MSSINHSIESSTDTEQKTSIKILLKEKNLNPKKSEDLKYLLSLSLIPKKNKFKFNFHSLISYLLKYKTAKNESIFYNFFFQSCELGKITNVKILLKNNLDINKQNELGETPLHIAISKNDENLVKLLIKHEPRTDILSYKDGFSVMNYAEICGNKNIIKIVNELNQKNLKNKIKSEVVDFIKKDMININANNISNLSCFSKNKNFDEIQNYNGEKVSILLNDDTNNSIVINNKSWNTSNINNLNNKDTKNKKDEKINTNTQIIKNDSEIYEDIISKKNIKAHNYNTKTININNNIIISEAPQNININFPSPSKKKEVTSSLKSSSYIQSLKTSHTLNECSPILKNKKNRIDKFLSKKIELNKFIKEINLPEKYTEILIENGFDDLEVLINQTKKGLALSYQNLRDIGISLPAHRMKILIHLEEISDNFDFILQKNIIYSSKIPEEKSGSLYKFLLKINLDEYFQNFIENGFYCVELLYTQMGSKNPITEEILRDDLGIDKLGHLQRVLISLKEESKKYLEKLPKKSDKDKNNNSKNIIYEENPYFHSCEACFIF